MILATKPHTLGNRKRWVVDYSQWLPTGVTIDTATVTTTSTTSTVANVTLLAGTKVVFFIEDGELNETFTVDIQIVDTHTGIKNDTIQFTVIAA